MGGCMCVGVWVCVGVYVWVCDEVDGAPIHTNQSSGGGQSLDPVQGIVFSRSIAEDQHVSSPSPPSRLPFQSTGDAMRVCKKRKEKKKTIDSHRKAGSALFFKR